MIIVIDSGGTKSDLLLVDQEREGRHLSEHYTTTGINPTVMNAAELVENIRQWKSCLQHDSPAWGDSGQPQAVTRAYWYCAGCRDEVRHQLEEAFHAVFPNVVVEVCSDLVGAARALYGRQPGIACILGTGSNSGYYDGHTIMLNTPPLGYILGDEGSGAALGRQLINTLYKMPQAKELCSAFEQWRGLTLPKLIDRVYHQPRPNAFLASLVPFISQHITNPLMKEMVTEEFRCFARRNLQPYLLEQGVTHVAAVGGVACTFEEQLSEALHEEGFELTHTLKAPVERLGNYHLGIEY